jgi:hypothetical protein
MILYLGSIVLALLTYYTELLTALGLPITSTHCSFSVKLAFTVTQVSMIAAVVMLSSTVLFC